jgi:membrane protease YdiL (CAAX protease family)
MSLSESKARPAAPDRQAMQRRGLVVYLTMAFGLAWLVQVGLVFGLRGVPGGLASLGSGSLVVALLLMWPPALGAFVARRWVEHGGFGDAGLHWPSWPYVLVAWLGPAALTAAAALLSLPIYPFDATFSGLQETAARLGQTLPAPPAVIVAGQLGLALTLAVPINAVFAFGEEFGWRGYLLPRLIEQCGHWPGLLLHGAIWGFWHAPLIFLSGYNYPGHPLLGVPWFVVACMLLGVLFGWLALASRSVLPPTLAHAAFNAVGPAPLLFLRGMNAAVGGVLWSPIGWLVLLAAIAVLMVSGRLTAALGTTTEPA